MCEIKGYNEIYDDRIKKLSVNLPLELYAKLSKHCHERKKFGGMISVDVREILEKALEQERIEKQFELWSQP